MGRAASRDVETTLRLARDRTELEIARYRIWVYAAVVPLTLVIGLLRTGGALAVGAYFSLWLAIAVGIFAIVKRFGARSWIGAGSVLLDVVAMSLVFPMAQALAPPGEENLAFLRYVTGASLAGILAINTLRDDAVAAWVGSLAAVVAFLAVVLPLDGFSPAQLPVVLILALLGLIGAAMARRTRRTLEDFARMRVLRRFVPEQLVAHVLDDERLAKLDLGGEERTVTVLASDLRGFTAMSERLTPAEIVSQLNDYHGAMLEVVQRHGGMLDKFIGDGMLVVFGLQGDDDHGAAAAVACASDMLTALESLNATRTEQKLAALRAGIGIHTGPVVAGSIGAADRMEYTVIGDTVNTAARLEGLTKEAGVQVLVTAATAERLPSQDGLKPLPPMSARGKQLALDVFTLS